MSQNGEKHGFAAALATLDVGGGVPALVGDLQDDMFEPETARALPPARRVGAKGGRPAGAANRSTREFRDWALRVYGSPTLALLEIGARTPRELAEQLHLTTVVDHLAPGQEALTTIRRDVGEGDNATTKTSYLVWDLERAFGMQRAAWAAAQPYVDQKQPMAVEVSDSKRGLLVIDMAVAGAISDAQPLFDVSEENQSLSASQSGQSDDGQSDASGKDSNGNDLG